MQYKICIHSHTAQPVVALNVSTVQMKHSFSIYPSGVNATSRGLASSVFGKKPLSRRRLSLLLGGVLRHMHDTNSQIIQANSRFLLGNYVQIF